MLSRYAHASLKQAERVEVHAHRESAGPQTEDASESLQNPSEARSPTEYSRFQPGALSPVDERPARRNGAHVLSPAAGHLRQAAIKPLKLFDRALLVAEVASALVVTWLVAQYIYTAYIDTAPRRVSPPRSAYRASGAAPTFTNTPTPTATRLAAATAATVVPADGGLGAGWAVGDANGAEAAPSSTSGPTSTPTVAPELLLPTRLRIPVMFLDSPIDEVTVNMGEWEVAPLNVGHHEGTANPGEVGNMVLAAHRDIYSALFRELDRLEPGDEVFVSNSLREYRYRVVESFVVSPEQTEVMDPSDDKRVTLITCTPIGLSTQRLIVTAILDEEPGGE